MILAVDPDATSGYAVGIELSTQSGKMVVLNLEDAGVTFAGAFDYDTCFPVYNTEGGVLPSTPGIRHTSPMMLIEAVDHAFDMMVKQGVDLSRVKAVKVDGMQHCTVYTDGDLSRYLGNLDAERTLVEQLGPCITRRTSPIWEDRSTAAETEYLTAVLTSHGGIHQLTGNRAELRFPASQVLKWAKESPEEYLQTRNISVLSAFISAILAGTLVPVDTGDGWGTNLNHLDIHRPGWSETVLSVADGLLGKHGLRGSLGSKLGHMDHYDAPAGIVAPYFAERYGVSPTARVLIGTGDNPATLLGCGGHMVVSLGSSYTVNGAMGTIAPSAGGEYNVFGYTRGKAMALSVFTNGGKVHEAFVHRYLNLPEARKPAKADWARYAGNAGSLQLSPDEKLMLPYLLEESVPLRREGIIRDGFPEDDASASIRALHLSQVLAMKLHSDHLGDVDELCIVGGASANPAMRQWIADAFQARTFSIRNADNAAPFGCALSGAAAVLDISYAEAAERFIRRDDGSVCDPIPENRDVMAHLVARYRDLERLRGEAC